MSEAGTEGLFRRQGRGKRAAAKSRQQALGGERWFQCWEGPPATKRARGEGGAVDNASFENSLLGNGAWGAPGSRHRAAPPPADERGQPTAGPRVLWRGSQGEQAGRNVGGGARAHPNPRTAAGPGFPGVGPAYRRWTCVGSGRRRPCRSWRSYAPGSIEDGQSRVCSGRPFAAFCKHAATTCRPVRGPVRARPLAENSI